MSTPTIPVRGEIKLGQFVKLASLAEDGAQARELIQASDVTVNGEVETRRGHHLSVGDLVEVDAPWGRAAAIVGSASYPPQQAARAESHRGPARIMSRRGHDPTRADDSLDMAEEGTRLLDAQLRIQLDNRRAPRFRQV